MFSSHHTSLASATIDYKTLCSKQRPRCSVVSVIALRLDDTVYIKLEKSYLRRQNESKDSSWSLITLVYSWMTHSSASFNGKHNFGFLRRKKREKKKSWRAELSIQKYLIKIWHSSPLFANVCVPRWSKYFSLNLFTLWLLIHIYMYITQMTTN